MGRFTSVLLSASALAATLFAASCGGGGSGHCSFNSDCSTGHYCLDGTCTADCSDDMQCVARLGAGAVCSSFGMCLGMPDASAGDAGPTPVDAAVGDDVGADGGPPDVGAHDAWANDASSWVGASCLAIHMADPTLPDGVYPIMLSPGGMVSVHCLMSADGGGWTLVGNFPVQPGTAGVAGWTSGARVGTDFVDLTAAFKLSDAEINSLRSSTANVAGFRAHGTATMCYSPGLPDPSPCMIDTTLFWSGTCAYASGAQSTACNTPFRDAALTMAFPATTPCPQHYGLVASDCAMYDTMGTSHMGDHVFVGDYAPTAIHAYDGRAGENPAVQFWVR